MSKTTWRLASYCRVSHLSKIEFRISWVFVGQLSGNLQGAGLFWLNTVTASKNSPSELTFVFIFFNVFFSYCCYCFSSNSLVLFLCFFYQKKYIMELSDPTLFPSSNGLIFQFHLLQWVCRVYEWTHSIINNIPKERIGMKNIIIINISIKVNICRRYWPSVEWSFTATCRRIHHLHIFYIHLWGKMEVTNIQCAISARRELAAAAAAIIPSSLCFSPSPLRPHQINLINGMPFC